MKDQELLLEETKRRMRKLYEYTYYNSMDEDEEQSQQAQAPEADPSQMGGDPAQMGGDPAQMGGDPTQMGGDPTQMGGDPSQMGGDPSQMGGDPAQMGGDPNAGGINGANLAPNAGIDGNVEDPMGGDPTATGEQPGPDDNVIDITQLTDAQDELKANQEHTSEQLEDVDSKLITLMKVVDKFTQALNDNDEKLNDLKREIQKRTPTEEETMNVRLNAGGNPFDQKPEEFWDKFKDINNHYNITTNNEPPQYEIKKSDIDNVNDKLVNDEIDDIPHSLHEYFIK
jgi:hypothetical protein